MYYNTCDVSLSTLDELPEDAVPEDFYFQHVDEELPRGHVPSELFVDWMNLGRHDCEIAKALGYTWTQDLKTSGNETASDLFQVLLAEYREEMEETLETNPVEEVVPDGELPMQWLAAYISRICAPFSFKVEGDTPETIRDALADLMAREMQSVQGYVSTWRSNGAMYALKSKDVEAETHDHLRAHAFAWPQIYEEPSRERSDGRFVKAFPLVFPMGVADLYQPRLRSDFSVVDAVQHLFRYHTGHLLRSGATMVTVRRGLYSTRL